MSDVKNITKGKLFIPISVGNHWYSNHILSRLFSEIISSSSTSVIFLCDRLRFLSYKIRGEIDDQLIKNKVLRQTNQMKKTFSNVGINRYPHASVESWSTLETDQRYEELLHKLTIYINEDNDLSADLRKEAERSFKRFGSDNHEDEILFNYQCQYIIEETCLSIFMNELREFDAELYRKGMGFVDLLYEKHNDKLSRLIGTEQLKRQFVSLESLFSEK